MLCNNFSALSLSTVKYEYRYFLVLSLNLVIFLSLLMKRAFEKFQSINEFNGCFDNCFLILNIVLFLNAAWGLFFCSVTSFCSLASPSLPLAMVKNFLTSFISLGLKIIFVKQKKEESLPLNKKTKKYLILLILGSF